MDQARNLCTASKKAAVEDSMALDSANQCDSPSSPDANLITSVDETIGDIDMMDVFENLSDDDQEIAMAHQLAVEVSYDIRERPTCRDKENFVLLRGSCHLHRSLVTSMYVCSNKNYKDSPRAPCWRDGYRHIHDDAFTSTCCNVCVESFNG